MSFLSGSLHCKPSYLRRSLASYSSSLFLSLRFSHLSFHARNIFFGLVGGGAFSLATLTPNLSSPSSSKSSSVQSFPALDCSSLRRAARDAQCSQHCMHPSEDAHCHVCNAVINTWSPRPHYVRHRRQQYREDQNNVRPRRAIRNSGTASVRRFSPFRTARRSGFLQKGA